MVQAYILVQTEVGKAADVATAIGEIGGVTQADDVTGPYDVIVRAEADNVDTRRCKAAVEVRIRRMRDRCASTGQRFYNAGKRLDERCGDEGKVVRQGGEFGDVGVRNTKVFCHAPRIQ